MLEHETKLTKSSSNFGWPTLLIGGLLILAIGLLLSLKFGRWQAKARQASAQSLLTQYLTAQQATMSEYRIFPGDFPGAGFHTTGSPYRLVASHNPNALGIVPNSSPNCTTTAPHRICPDNYPPITEGPLAADPTQCKPKTLGAEGERGEITACAALRLEDGTQDEMQINQDKVIQVFSPPSAASN
ncbi:MAG TPA: hypothetical protein PLZ57_03240 [Pseudobdellovibrionaceae bacterium]|nr:hypothetical protein [Pseudobdellovibrionaceae bacterium]